MSVKVETKVKKPIKKNPTTFKEKDILDYVDDFDYQIKVRGQEYFDGDKVKYCYKNNNKYYSKVEGSNKTDYYNVEISVDGTNVEYSCTCPYENPCKHEYATLIAISKKEYTKPEFKEEIILDDIDMQDIINSIPADELKTFFLEYHLLFNLDKSEEFESYFYKYFPKPSYEYYYNRLYNDLILESVGSNCIYEYLYDVDMNIGALNFETAYYILKSIVEVYNDTNHLNLYSHLTKAFAIVGMNLRIVYRKCDEKLRKEIDVWFKYLKENKFYDNFYLEDVVISVK